MSTSLYEEKKVDPKQRRESEKGIWKSYVQLLFRAKLPWAWIIGLTLFYLLNTWVTLQFPEYTQKILSGNLDDAVVYGAIIIIIAGIILAGILNYISALTRYKIDMSYRNLIWQRLMFSPLELYNRVKPNEMVSRTANDTKTVSTILGSMIPAMIGSLYGVYGVITQIFDYDYRLALGVLVYIPVYIGFNIWYGKWRFRTNKETHNRLSVLTQFLSERLLSIPLIKSFAMENKEIELGKQNLLYYYRAAFRRAVVDWINNPLQGVLNLAQDMFVIGFGIYLVSTGAITIEIWIAFFMYVGMLWGILESYSMLYTQIKQSQGSTARIAELIDGDLEQYERERPLENTTNDILLNHVDFSYEEDKKIISDLSFRIPYGKTTAIVGPSGSGKTTVLSLIQNFYSVDQGEILFGNTNINDFHLHEWRNMFSYVAQDSPLLSGTIRKNITYGVDRDVSDDELKKVAQAANALEFILDTPNGFDSDVGEGGSSLSGGQRQRINIARALLRDADFLVLDEAMSSLDSKSEQAIGDAMNKLVKGRTSIVVAHDLSTIRDADQIVVLDKGSVESIGTHEELLKTSTIYHSFVEYLTRESNS